MTRGGKKESLILFAGDLVCFGLALWLTLWARYGEIPSSVLFGTHLTAFSLIFLVWTLVFFISDLYRKQTMVFEHSLPQLILRAQIINSLLAGLIFYFIPYYRTAGLAPRFNLFLDLLFSFILITLWRRYLARLLYRGRPIAVAFECAGQEVDEVKQVLATHSGYNARVVTEHPTTIVYDQYELDNSTTKIRDLYRFLFRGVSFVSIQVLYEDMFGRVPLSLINERWFLERVSNQPQVVYDIFKRCTDVLVAGAAAVVSLVVYPFIWLAIRLEDGGPLFYRDERVGKNGRPITIYKFRSMSLEPDLSSRHVTRVGRFLRKSRLDELPQLWSVVTGAQSLIGPRPEKSDYVTLYRDEIPFYDIRHLIAPGLSGWAQIYQEGHPHFTTSSGATREKLSYDLYYVKHRSLWLDLTIGLKTIKTLLSRKGI